jgi:hypothetical protein
MIIKPLQRIAAAAFPGSEPISGFREEQIASEARLKLAIPDAVKDYYSVAGARDLKRMHYSMLPPEKLRLDGDHLIFCEENEGLGRRRG